MQQYQPREPIMNPPTIVVLLGCWLMLGTTTVRADTLYLPVALHKTASNAIYQIDHLRLWHISENYPSGENMCGYQPKLQVHVFDQHGDSGGGSRLNGVIVQAIWLKNGQRSEEFRATGLPGFDAGVAEFALAEQAEVRIFTDVDGRLVASQTAFVTTQPKHISSERLIASGYCQDEASCQSFVEANQCAGQFSWNVVFKRSY
jgi:hypothetical protein